MSKLIVRILKCNGQVVVNGISRDISVLISMDLVGRGSIFVPGESMKEIA